MGVINGLSGILNNTFKKKDLIETIISCPRTPCPTSPKLAEKYYPTKNDISNKIYKKITGRKLRLKKIDFYEIHTVSKVNLDELLKKYQFLFWLIKKNFENLLIILSNVSLQNYL